MKRNRRLGLSIGAVALGGLAAAAAFFLWPHGLDPVAPSADQSTGAALIARGAYLTRAADCAACHTMAGGKDFAGGLPFKLPFGTIYAPNITPDPRHGIGAWSDAEFVRALRQGVGRHGEDLYPAFPYTSYALLTTDDALAIRAYLRTVAPVAIDAPSNSLAFPFNQRPLMRGWKLLFLPSRGFNAVAARGAAWNRGAYLVEGLAHCGECHTPRNLLFARAQGRALGGGEVDGWKAWNITSDKESGIGGWSDRAIADYLSTGHAVDHGTAAGSMRQAIDLSFSKLTPADIADMIAYLRTVPPVRSDLPARVNAAPPVMRASLNWRPPASDRPGLGRRIFEGACASCHGWSGGGQQSPRAALAGAHAVNDPEGANLIRAILQGSMGEDNIAAKAMPAFARAYSDTEIAAVSNYVIGHFGGKTGKVTPAIVASARAQ